MWFRRFDPCRDIEEFHQHFGLRYDGSPRFLPKEMGMFRTIFMAEELVEYVADKPEVLKSLIQSALVTHDQHPPLEKQFDALIDLVYVALGTSYLHGFDFKEGWNRVHSANMKKIRSISSESHYGRGSSFDVIKPPGWTPPVLTDLVR